MAVAMCAAAVGLDVALPDPPRGAKGLAIVWIAGWLFTMTMFLVVIALAARLPARSRAVEDPT